MVPEDARGAGSHLRGQVQFHTGSQSADRQQGDLAGLHEEFSLDRGLPGAGRDAVSLQLQAAPGPALKSSMAHTLAASSSAISFIDEQPALCQQLPGA